MQTSSLSDHVTPQDDYKAITAALQSAIDRAAEQGGVVTVPPGVWTTTMISLRSGVTLRLARGAVLRAHTDVADYPQLQHGHNKDRQPYHLLFADGCQGFTVEGEGVIDGQGMEFWNPPLGDRNLGAKGLFYREKKQRVSPLIEIRNSSDFLLRDFTIRDSPGWTLHTYLCDRLRITGVTVDNHLFGPNTDGFDINGCRDVFISDCSLRCGDDAIIIKTTEDARSSERIAVSNCIIESNCAALGLGAESTHDIRDVTFSNCVIRAALRIIHLEMWEAGTFENITFTNITGRNMSGVPLERPIYLDIQSHTRTDSALGRMRNIVISNFTAETRGRIVITAKDGALIENVTLRDVVLRYPEIEDAKFTVNHMHSIQMSNNNPLTRDARAAVVADNVRGLFLHNVVTTWPAEDADPAEPAGAPYPGIHGQLPVHALWFRNVQNGVVDCPGLTPSQTGVRAAVLDNSELEIRCLNKFRS